MPLLPQQHHLGESLLGLEDFSLQLCLIVLVTQAVKSPHLHCTLGKSYWIRWREFSFITMDSVIE